MKTWKQDQNCKKNVTKHGANQSTRAELRILCKKRRKTSERTVLLKESGEGEEEIFLVSRCAYLYEALSPPWIPIAELCLSMGVGYPCVYACNTRSISSPIVDGGGQQPQHHSSASALGRNSTQSLWTEMGLCSKHPSIFQTPLPSLVVHGIRLRSRVPTLDLGAAYVMQARSITSPRLT